TERATTGSAWQVWKTMWLAVVLAVALAALTVTRAPWSLPLVLPWLLAPAIAHALSQPPVRRREVLDERSRADALRFARLHWAYFDRHVNESTHWLPPDNVQVDPAVTVAMRTSPTNIGLHLLSLVSAHDLGFIPRDDLRLRLDRTLTTLEALPRYRGHFYNWYSLEDLRVLEPAYVSTVDSGNLAGHLIAVRQACIELGMEDLAERAVLLAMKMDFRFLYDASRNLFAIGYHTGTHTLDASSYDLLASEARLAS